MNFEYIIANPQGGFILKGCDGGGVFEQALELATDIVNYNLGTGINAYDHPDVYIIDLEDGARNIKLSQIELVQEHRLKYPVYARCNVFIINHADTMHEESQSTLLKMLEDNCGNNCIIMCCENNLLDTIKNRCQIFSAGRKLTAEELEGICGQAITDVRTIKALSDGLTRPVWLFDMCKAGVIKDIAAMADSFKNLTQPRELLFSFNAMTEKKEDMFTENYSSVEQKSLITALCLFCQDILEYKLAGQQGKYLTISELDRLSSRYSVKVLVASQELMIQSLDMITKRMFTTNDWFRLVKSLADV